MLKWTRWQFITDDGDIGFYIAHIKENGEEVSMLPRERYDSHQMMEEGEIACIYEGNCNT